MATSKYSKRDPGPKTKKLSQSERKYVVPRDQYPEGLTPRDGYDVIMTPMQRWNAEHMTDGIVKNKPGFQSTDSYSRYETQRQQDGIDYQKDPLHPNIQKAGTFENEMHNMYILDNDLAGVQTFNDRQGQTMGNNGYYYRQSPSVQDAAEIALQKKAPVTSVPATKPAQPLFEMRPYYGTYNKPGTAGYKKDMSLIERTSPKRMGGVIPPTSRMSKPNQFERKKEIRGSELDRVRETQSGGNPKYQDIDLTTRQAALQYALSRNKNTHAGNLLKGK